MIDPARYLPRGWSIRWSRDRGEFILVQDEEQPREDEGPVRDPIGPARGCLVGVLICLVFWLGLYLLWRLL